MKAKWWPLKDNPFKENVKQITTSVYGIIGEFGKYGQGELNILTVKDYFNSSCVEVWYDNKGTLSGKEERKYDHNFNEIESKSYDSKGNQISHVRFVYNEEGKQLEELHFDHLGGNWLRKVTKYDEFGQERQTEEFDEKNRLESKHEIVSTPYCLDRILVLNV